VSARQRAQALAGALAGGWPAGRPLRRTAPTQLLADAGQTANAQPPGRPGYWIRHGLIVSLSSWLRHRGRHPQAPPHPIVTCSRVGQRSAVPLYFYVTVIVTLVYRNASPLIDLPLAALADAAVLLAIRRPRARRRRQRLRAAGG
jgi:hypothetical protein